MTPLLKGSLDPTKIRDGKPRGRHGIYQRRVRPAVFGEPQSDEELVPESICPARPHILAYEAWQKLAKAAHEAGLPEEHLAIHSAYRSVALQVQIWEYRLNERRENRAKEGLPLLSQRDLERQQMKWTAKPGQSAHHTGLALDLGLYHLGKRASKRTKTYDWLCHNARDYGFYPYLPEAWHWEYNPPGLLEKLKQLR